MRVGDPFRRRWNLRRREDGGLSGEAAERALIAAMPGGRVLVRRAIVDVGAECGRIAEGRFELGRYRGVVRPSEGRRGERRRRCGGEKLNDKRERDDESGEPRAKRAQPSGRSPRSTPGCPAADFHFDIPLLRAAMRLTVVKN
jgi:hypothetical protein